MPKNTKLLVDLFKAHNYNFERYDEANFKAYYDILLSRGATAEALQSLVKCAIERV